MQRQTMPKWQREISSFKGIKSTFILEGNINDFYPVYPEGDENALPMAFVDLNMTLFKLFNESHASCEYEFMFYLKAGELDETLPPEAKDEEILINGISDCVIEKEDSIVIIDYKTDRVKEAGELIDRYSRQLELYKRAIGPRFAKPVEKCVIWSFELSKEVIVEV